MPDSSPSRADKHHPSARWGRSVLAVIAVAALIVAGVLLATQKTTTMTSASTGSTRTLQSIFEDDLLLIDQPLTPAGNATVARTLATLRSLGVDRLRLVVGWYYIAPDNSSPTPPPGFKATDPAAYPGWAPYDRIDRLAQKYGLAVDFDISSPGPVWGMAPGAPDAKTSLHYIPSATRFRQFATAIGRRYDGHYRPAGAASPLPRVSFWSIWNEPNQPGWLAPQWVRSGGSLYPYAARLYREIVDAGYAGLAASGHTPASDTILFGELAPEGCVSGSPCVYPRPEWPIPPVPFLQAMYCLNSSYQPLSGAAANVLACPSSGSRSAFVSANPALFHASGLAYHPYAFYLAPNVSMSNQNFAPLADLGRVETVLDRSMSAYGTTRQLPLYLTEYGYETNPPRTVPPMTSLADQARYLDEAAYLSWRDPRVRGLAQFLLRDSAPDTNYPPGSRRYWSTFQTGLEFLNGTPKPSFSSYRLPIFVPQTSVRAGANVQVWGMLRAAPNGSTQTAKIQWRPAGGAYRTIDSVTTTNPSGFIDAGVKPPSSGTLRILWRSAAGRLVASRPVPITVGG